MSASCVRTAARRLDSIAGIEAPLPVPHLPERPNIELLPIAATVVALTDAGAPRLVSSNAALAAFGGLACDDPPVLAAAAMIRSRDERGEPFRWRRGDAVSGRHFDVHLSPLNLSCGGRGCLVMLIDRTAEHEGIRSLQAELTHDSLTGLPNRAAFAEAVDTLVGAGGDHAVVLVDLARFGRINQSLGAMAGDEVIISVARRLLSTLRAGDLVARIGGDEFGLLIALGPRGADEATAAAARIRGVLGAPFRLSRFEVAIDCAIGCALSRDADEAGDEIVRRAQLALKRAKESGRLEIHRPGEAERARQALDVETELRRAIERRELTLAYQPIVSLRDDRLIGFEALARWTHPERGPISPGEFIAVAEEAGLIVPLGRFALDTALATLARWDAAAGRPLPIAMSVNISAIQFGRDDVPVLVAGALADHGLSGERLTVELTESAIARDPDRITRAMRALKALDVRIAMDDFGTGYSSLSVLRRLPIDILKIDRSFVTGMLDDRDKIAIVRAVLSLADALGKTTTAEGVETLELARTLAALGCTAAQGYSYARPLDEQAALAFMRARTA